jgi:hypothetical protein
MHCELTASSVCGPRSNPIHKVKWTDNEDKRLLAHIEQYGTSNWSAVAAGMYGRTGKQCRERWTNCLDPSLNRDAWTPQEDAVLLHQQSARGNCWSKIAEFLPHRSANALKNRWCWLARHNAVAPEKGKRGGGEEMKKEEMASISIQEWSEALEFPTVPEFLNGDQTEEGMDGWAIEPAWEKCDRYEFQWGMLSWA